MSADLRITISLLTSKETAHVVPFCKAEWDLKLDHNYSKEQVEEDNTYTVPEIEKNDQNFPWEHTYSKQNESNVSKSSLVIGQEEVNIKFLPSLNMDLKMCRICLEYTAAISLFDKQDDSIQYSSKIMQCVNIEIVEGDGLPSAICASCVNELAAAFDFIDKCLASDKALRCLHSTGELCDETHKLTVKQEDIKHEPEQEYEEYIADFDKQEYTKDEDSSDKLYKMCKKTRKKTRVGPMQCVMCGLMVNSQSAMDIHMRTHTGERPYTCDYCNTSYQTKGSLKRHTETHHTVRERKFTCETCGNSFFRKNDITIHMRVHTDERPYVCPYCNKKFRQIASLIRHKRVHTKEKPYSCPVCDKKFADKSLVSKHLSVHSDEKKFICHLCSKSVKSKNALNSHLKLHNNEKQNMCSFCGMAFSVKGNLQTHIRRVHSEKSGQCCICLKTFSDLEAHMRKHTGEKPFICDICSQAFGSKRSLAHHMVFRHENASKYKCSIGECTKTFPTAMMLEFHLLKQHTNHTPYVCQHCSRGFFRISDLTRHLRVSHNVDTNAKVLTKTVDS